MRTVHVGIRHDDDFMVAQFLNVERALTLTGADTGANCGNHRADFAILEHLVEARLLHVDQFASNRQNRLKLSVAPLLGRTTCRVALHDVQLGVDRVAVGAVGQFARQPAAGHRRFADGIACLARRLAGSGRGQTLVDDFFTKRRVGVEIAHQALVNNRRHDALHLAVHQLDLGLRLEAGIRQLDAQDADQALTHIIAGEARILLLQQLVRLGVLVDRARERRAETGQVSAAVGVGDRVGEAQNLVVVTRVVLHHTVHDDFVLGRVERDRLGVDDLLVFADLLDELHDALLVKKRLRLAVLALVNQHDGDARIQERQLAQSMVQNLRLVLGRDGENYRVRHEGDLRAGLVRLADNVEWLGGFALRKLDVVHLAVTINLRLKPDRERVHALGANPVQPAGVLVRPLAELAARVQIGEHQLDRRHIELLVRVHRDAAPVVLHRHRAVHVDRDLYLVAIASQVLVDRVVEHLVHTVMKSFFVRVADVHPRPLPHGLQTLEFVNFRCVVPVGTSCCFRHFFFFFRDSKQDRLVAEIKLKNRPPHERQVISKNTLTLQPLNPLFSNN